MDLQVIYEKFKQNKTDLSNTPELYPVVLKQVFLILFDSFLSRLLHQKCPMIQDWNRDQMKPGIQIKEDVQLVPCNIIEGPYLPAEIREKLDKMCFLVLLSEKLFLLFFIIFEKMIIAWDRTVLYQLIHAPFYSTTTVDHDWMHHQKWHASNFLWRIPNFSGRSRSSSEGTNFLGGQTLGVIFRIWMMIKYLFFCS